MSRTTDRSRPGQAAADIGVKPLLLFSVEAPSPSLNEGRHGEGETGHRSQPEQRPSSSKSRRPPAERSDQWVPVHTAGRANGMPSLSPEKPSPNDDSLGEAGLNSARVNKYSETRTFVVARRQSASGCSLPGTHSPVEKPLHPLSFEPFRDVQVPARIDSSIMGDRQATAEVATIPKRTDDF